MSGQGREDWLTVVHRVREDDPAALARLTALITGVLYRLGAYRVKESWEDICQDVLAALVRSVEEGRLREPQAFVRFACVLTRNHFVDYIQRCQRVTSGGRRDETAARESLDRVIQQPAEGAEPDVMLDLERALGTLSSRSRRVVEEIYLRGRTYQEVADRLGIPFGTVKRLQTTGLRKLRDALLVGASDHAAVAASRAPEASVARCSGRSAVAGGRGGG